MNVWAERKLASQPFLFSLPVFWNFAPLEGKKAKDTGCLRFTPGAVIIYFIVSFKRFGSS